MPFTLEVLNKLSKDVKGAKKRGTEQFTHQIENIFRVPHGGLIEKEIKDSAEILYYQLSKCIFVTEWC